MHSTNIRITERNGALERVIDISALAQAPTIELISTAVAADAEQPVQAHPYYTKIFDDSGKHVATLDSRTNLLHADAGSEREMTADEAFEASRTLGLLGGGWRPPTSHDLDPIIDRTRSGPALDLEYFPWAKSDWYWLHDNNGSCAWSSAHAWYVSLGNGYVGNSHRDYRYGFAWAVRAASQ